MVCLVGVGEGGGARPTYPHLDVLELGEVEVATGPTRSMLLLTDDDLSFADLLWHGVDEVGGRVAAAAGSGLVVQCFLHFHH